MSLYLIHKIQSHYLWSHIGGSSNIFCIFGHQFSDSAKIRYFQGLKILEKQKILRFKIAMNDISQMQVVHGLK